MSPGSRGGAKREAVDLRLYLVTSGAGRAVVETVIAAVRGGVRTVQVRCKDADTRELYELTAAVARAVAATDPGVSLLVDDRADVAWAARHHGEPVHGVHLGQNDLPPQDARALLGPDAIIGLTTGTLDLVEAAARLDGVIDYVGAGPFRPTPTKDSGRPPIGLGGYPALVEASSVPVVAIGDIGVDDVGALRRTGVAGVAVVRAIMGASDPEQVARRIRAAWEAAEG